jgi:putative NIF3 family GTP cyclohydrolase 1 type 2
MLGLADIKRFGMYHGQSIGFSGRLKPGKRLADLVRIMNGKLNVRCATLPFGPQRIQTVAVVSGGGAAAMKEAIRKRLDCFVTGEGPHGLYHFAKEANMHVILGGHYATETLGVKALQRLLKEKFNIETVFIDVPTGM